HRPRPGDAPPRPALVPLPPRQGRLHHGALADDRDRRPGARPARAPPRPPRALPGPLGAPPRRAPRARRPRGRPLRPLRTTCPFGHLLPISQDTMARISTPLTEALGVDVPLICGAMYPCSNPELVAAASAAGGVGIIQPISMIYVHKRPLRDGIREIRAITQRPIGFNAIVEQSSKVYEDRMRGWVDVALEEGVR